mmetsp:Transcript_4209/g.9140  ORF Transcript_4209/g.9140 Transcript_4209/m.9140 type:complete len:210 (+) Transcript_4209:455-1084(+)
MSQKSTVATWRHGEASALAGAAAACAPSVGALPSLTALGAREEKSSAPQSSASTACTSTIGSSACRQCSPSLRSLPKNIEPSDAPNRDAEAMRVSCAGRSAGAYVAPMIWQAAPQVTVYASELSHHMAPKTATFAVLTRTALETKKPVKTATSNVQPPNLSVIAPPRSLPKRQTAETPASISFLASTVRTNSGSTMIEVSTDGTITRPV